MAKSKAKSKTPRSVIQPLSIVPAGKIKCYITGTLRPDKPEEHVRQRMARSLVEEYGYPKSDIEIEWSIKIGVSKKRADIVVFTAGSVHKTENIEIIVEAKRDSVVPTNSDNGVDQLKSYLSATLNSKFGLWIGKEIRAYEKIDNAGTWEISDCIDIPFADGKLRVAHSFADLVPATDVLKDVFARCHNYITGNQGTSKEAAFHEFLKIIFCKVFDERYSSEPKFFINPDERKTIKGQKNVDTRIQSLFKDVCGIYGYIFGKEEEISLTPNIIAYIVSELQKYSLLDTDFDYKGQAYEEIVGANSRGDRGEFFTPRNLCKLAVDISMEIIGTDKMKKIRVLDPSCGTGGFLKTFVHTLNELLFADEMKKRGGNIEKAKAFSREALKAICDKNIFGIDFNPVLVRAAQMNLVMNGDGSSNVFHENSLKSYGEFSDTSREHLKDSSFDLIISNPPFGKDLAVDDSHTLDQYELSKFEASNQRTIMAPQELFIERSWRLLKPEGIYAVVTPDNIVSNPSYRYMRHWILLKFKVIACINLPIEMFRPSTGTQTTLLILKKMAKPFQNLDEVQRHRAGEHIFMSIPNKVGHDQRGNIIPLRDEEGNVILRPIYRKKIVKGSDGLWHEDTLELYEPTPFDLLPKVFEDFKVWFDHYKNEL